MEIINNFSLVTEFPTSFNESATARPYWKDQLEKWTSIIVTGNLILLMVGMGAATYLKDVWHNLKKPWGSVIGMICQFGIMPAVGMGLVIYFELPPFEAIGVLLVCCSPGGAFSNFFAYWLNGDIALSILMTATSSLLAFGGMPLNMWIYSRRWTDETIQIPYKNILISMACATGPAIVGMIIRNYTRIWARRITVLCSALGWIGALTAMVFLVLINWKLLLTATWNLYAVTVVLPFAGFLFGFIISKGCCFSNSVSRTIGVETGCQNTVVALSVVLNSFSDPKAREQMVVITMLYLIAQFAEVITLTGIFQCYKFAHRHEVTEELVKSKIDTKILIRVPTPLVETTYRPALRMDGPTSHEHVQNNESKFWPDTTIRHASTDEIFASTQHHIQSMLKANNKYSKPDFLDHYNQPSRSDSLNPCSQPIESTSLHPDNFYEYDETVQADSLQSSNLPFKHFSSSTENPNFIPESIADTQRMSSNDYSDVECIARNKNNANEYSLIYTKASSIIVPIHPRPRSNTKPSAEALQEKTQFENTPHPTMNLLLENSYKHPNQAIRKQWLRNKETEGYANWWKPDASRKIFSTPRSPSMNSGYGFPTFRRIEYE